MQAEVRKGKINNKRVQDGIHSINWWHCSSAGGLNTQWYIENN